MGDRSKNKEIASLFNEIADILELRESNRFRINAYRRAAQNIESAPRSVCDMAEKHTLNDIPGIGKDLEAKILEYIETGEISFLSELRNETPGVLLDMLRVPGIGPKTAVLLHRELNVHSLDELKRAAQSQLIRVLPKMRAKTEENILKGIEFLERSRGRTPVAEAHDLAMRIISSLEELSYIGRISAAGSLRRWRETVGDIDILATSVSPEEVIRHFTHLDDVERILAEGKTKGSVTTKQKIQVDLRVVAEKSYGAALNYFTGSKEHNIRLREIAIQKGMKLSEYGLFKKTKRGVERRVAGETEEEIYRVLGLAYIPPEIREDSGEIEAAREGRIPELVTAGDVRGDLHLHSDWSDGTMSLREIAGEGRSRGYSYVLITDHSKSLHVAHGLSEESIYRQIKAVDRINSKLTRFRLLKGCEVDILPDGTLDLNEKLLARLDIVVVAVHSNFKMDRIRMTKRVINAFENPFSHIFAHPTGRLIGVRDAYEIDMDEIIRSAAATGTALEINAHPMRLDLDSNTARKASEAGVLISIGTDAHRPAEMDYTPYGVKTARRGWLKKECVLNTRTASRLLGFLHRKSSGKK